MPQLDALDRQAAAVFEGYLGRKDLVRKYSQYPVPTYVVEFLLSRYCAKAKGRTPHAVEGSPNPRSAPCPRTW